MRGLKNIRLKEYDYRSNGYYFVTIVTDQRKKLLEDKRILIERELYNLKDDILGFDFDYFIVMPDHVHVIFVLDNCEFELGEIVRRLKSVISFRLKQKVWQPNYYEHVIRNSRALEKIREYIIYNPEKDLKKFDQFYK